MNKKKKSIVNIIQKIIVIILLIILAFNLYNVFGIVVFKKPMPKIFGYGRTIVITGSMEPSIEIGDMLIVKEQKDYKVGDIITFNINGTLITHRIVIKEGDTITTRGDANNTNDEPFNISFVEGKVVKIIPKAGKVVGFLSSTKGIIVLVLIGSVILGVPYYIEEKKYRKKEKSLEEDKKEE